MNKRIYLDTETTGTGKDDRVLQIAFLIDDGIKLKQYCEIVNPLCNIRKQASELHKIYPEDIIGKPLLQDSNSYKKLQEVNKRNNIIFIHNAHFDLRMLGYDGFKANAIVVDTLKLARHFMSEKSYKLENLRKKMKISNNEKLIMKKLQITHIDSHDALGDVISMKALVDYLLLTYPIDKLIKVGRYNVRQY